MSNQRADDNNNLLPSMHPQKHSSTPTVRTRILILSDTHCEQPRSAKDELGSTSQHAYRQPLPEADIVLHAGDLTQSGYMNEYYETLATLKNHPAELKLVIAGNHDITLDKEFYTEKLKKHGFHTGNRQDVDAVEELWCGEDARKHGLIYLAEGTRSFKLQNGASFTVYSSPYQPEYMGWAFAYDREEDRFNCNQSAVAKENTPYAPRKPTDAANPVPDFPGVDIMLTHGPPLNILDMTHQGLPVGCAHLLRAVRRCRPLLHCFGHIHEGWGATKMDWSTHSLQPVPTNNDFLLRDRSAYVDISRRGGPTSVERGRETMFVNAAIMTVDYKPDNAPWVVDIDLPVLD